MESFVIETIESHWRGILRTCRHAFTGLEIGHEKHSTALETRLSKWRSNFSLICWGQLRLVILQLPWAWYWSFFLLLLCKYPVFVVRRLISCQLVLEIAEFLLQMVWASCTFLFVVHLGQVIRLVVLVYQLLKLQKEHRGRAWENTPHAVRGQPRCLHAELSRIWSRNSGNKKPGTI